MKRLSSVFSVVMIAILLVSCGKDRTREQQVSAMINKVDGPFFVASMNVQDLMDKSEVMEEGTLPFTYYQVISFFLAVELTGIDYDTPAQFIVGEGESFLPNFYGIFRVNKEELFIELLEVEANAEIKEKDGFKYAIKDKEGYCVVWDEDFAVISNIPMDLAAMLSGKGGKQGEKMVDKNIEMIKAANEGEINEDYVSFLEKDADIAMMYEGEGFYKYMETVAVDDADEIEKLKEMYEGMSYQMFMNFEKGKMVIEMESDLDEDLRKKLAFIGENGVTNDLFKYGKSKSPLLTGTYKVDINGLLEYYQEIAGEDYDRAMEEMAEDGLVIEEVKEAFSGELVYMIDGIVKKQEVYDFGYDEPITISRDEPMFAVVLGVSDKGLIESKMQEMMMAGAQDLASTDEEMGEWEEDMPEMEMWPNGVVKVGDAHLFLMDDALFMTNDSSWANMIASGNGKKIDDPKDVLTKNPFGIYANLAGLSEMDMDEEGAEFAKMFASFYGSASLDGGIFTLEMSNSSENSLKLLTMAVGNMLAEFEEASNPDMMEELEEAVEETEGAFDKLDEIDEEEIEKAVDDAFKQLEEELNQ